MWKYLIIIILLAVFLYYITGEKKSVEEHIKNNNIEEACAEAEDELEVFDAYQKNIKASNL